MKRLLAAAMVLCASLLASQAIAQDKLVVPYPAGGLSDITGRLFATTMTQKGHPFIVENIGGATGTLAAQRFLNNPAGQIFQGSQNELILAPLTVPSVRYKSEDFVPFQYITQTYIMLAVRTGLKANNFAEFLELAEASRSTPLSYGTVGVGSLYHLIGEYLAKRKNLAFNHIPYKGGAPSMQDLIGGQIDFTITPYSTSFDDMVAKGMFKVIGIFSRERPASMARLQPASEIPGLQDFEFSSFAGYFLKSGAPPEQVRKYSDMIRAAIADPKLRDTLAADGRRVFPPMTPDEAATFYGKEVRKYKDLLKTVGPIDLK